MAILRHPVLLGEVTEDFAHLELAAPDLDKLRREIINIVALRPDLDAVALRLHLSQNGFARVVDGLFSPQIYAHARFVRPNADIEEVRRGWLHTRDVLCHYRQLAVEIDRAERGLAEDMTDATLAQLRALQAQLSALRDEKWTEELAGGVAQGGMR